MSEIKPCFVYLICSEVDGKLQGPCKVGISDKPDKRLRQVQTGSPSKLVIAFAFRIWNRRFAQVFEAAFHAAHEDHRLNGEWFDLSAKDALRGMVDTFKVGLDILLKDAPDGDAVFEQIVQSSNLMDAAKLLYKIYEAEGTLRKPLGGPLN
jgi:hypothetical protein